MFNCARIGMGTRSCAACHPLTEGGADGKLHMGVFTRPAKNALFGKFYLHDGSVSNLSALVRRMIEDDRFIGAGTLSNAVARLAEDGRIRRKFENCYGDGGLAGSNLVDSIVNYSCTLMTANGPFTVPLQQASAWPVPQGFVRPSGTVKPAGRSLSS